MRTKEDFTKELQRTNIAYLPAVFFSEWTPFRIKEVWECVAGFGQHGTCSMRVRAEFVGFEQYESIIYVEFYLRDIINPGKRIESRLLFSLYDTYRANSGACFNREISSWRTGLTGRVLVENRYKVDKRFSIRVNREDLSYHYYLTDGDYKIRQERVANEVGS